MNTRLLPRNSGFPKGFTVGSHQILLCGVEGAKPLLARGWGSSSAPRAPQERPLQQAAHPQTFLG